MFYYQVKDGIDSNYDNLMTMDFNEEKNIFGK
jgi:hypothetical protein